MGVVLRRRIFRFAILVAVAAAIVVVDSLYSEQLNRPAFLTGWILFTLFFLLALFNVRKRLSFLPLGRAYVWAQLHFYAGMLAGLVFLLHTGFSWPNGIFETMLALLFVLEILGGLYGLYISRAFPPRMLDQGEVVLFERIPSLRSQIIKDAEALVTRAVEQSGSRALAEFYTDKLLGYLEQPGDFWTHVLDSQRVRFAWDKNFEGLERFLAPEELPIATELKELVHAKIGLDMQYAKRSMLKYWLFVHIPVSYALVFFVVLHVLLVYGFSGS